MQCQDGQIQSTISPYLRANISLQNKSISFLLKCHIYMTTVPHSSFQERFNVLSSGMLRQNWRHWLFFVMNPTENPIKDRNFNDGEQVDMFLDIWQNWIAIKRLNYKTMESRRAWPESDYTLEATMFVVFKVPPRQPFCFLFSFALRTVVM